MFSKQKNRFYRIESMLKKLLTVLILTQVFVCTADAKKTYVRCDTPFKISIDGEDRHGQCSTAINEAWVQLAKTVKDLGNICESLGGFLRLDEVDFLPNFEKCDTQASHAHYQMVLQANQCTCK